MLRLVTARSTILVPITLLASLRHQDLGTRNEGVLLWKIVFKIEILQNGISDILRPSRLAMISLFFKLGGSTYGRGLKFLSPLIGTNSGTYIRHIFFGSIPQKILKGKAPAVGSLRLF